MFTSEDTTFMGIQWVTVVLTILKHTDESVEHHELNTCRVSQTKKHTHTQTNKQKLLPESVVLFQVHARHWVWTVCGGRVTPSSKTRRQTATASPVHGATDNLTRLGENLMQWMRDVCTFNAIPEYFVRLDNNVMLMKRNLKSVKLKHISW